MSKNAEEVKFNLKMEIKVATQNIFFYNHYDLYKWFQGMEPIPDSCFQMALNKIKSFQRCFSFLSKRNTQTVKNLNIKNRLLQTSILIWSVVLDPSWFSSPSFDHFWLDQHSIELKGMVKLK